MMISFKLLYLIWSLSISAKQSRKGVSALMIWNYTLFTGLLMSMVLIDIKALILNWTVTWPLINILRFINLSTTYRAWNWL